MIGAMRDIVVFKEPIDVPVPGGGAVSTYVESFRDWTKIEPLTSDRGLTDNQVQLQDGFRFNIRFRNSPQPNKKMLVEYEGRDYTINSIIERNERKRFWQITAVSNNDPAIPYTT